MIEWWHERWLLGLPRDGLDNPDPLVHADSLAVTGDLGGALERLAGSGGTGATTAIARLWADFAGDPAPTSPSPTPHHELDDWCARVLRARIAYRQGDIEDALFSLEHAAFRFEERDAFWAARRIRVEAITLRLSSPTADLLAHPIEDELHDAVPPGALDRALRAWLTLARGVSDAPAAQPNPVLVRDVVTAFDSAALPHAALAIRALAAALRCLPEPPPELRSLLRARLEAAALTLLPHARADFLASYRSSGHPRAMPSSGPAALPPASSPDRSLPRLHALMHALRGLARSQEESVLLTHLTQAAIELTGAERGFVLLRDLAPQDAGPEGGAILSLDVDDPEFSRSIAESVMLDARPIVTVDACHDPRVLDFPSVHALRLTSVACVPIRGRQGCTGALYLEHRAARARFVGEDLQLLEAFADQAAIAIDTARTLRSLRRREAELVEARSALEVALADARRDLEQTRREVARAVDPFQSGYERFGVLGRSEALRQCLARADRVRDQDLPVVLRGETGSGKELLARAMHALGPRADRPFVALGCASVPESLLESELFGHARGAFTGASRQREGVFARAHGGTLFLDAVEEMPARMQVALLRVLQEGHVLPVGADEEREVDVRIIAACRSSLAAAVEAGTFREDLLYRLCVVEIHVPSLRERPEDIPLLARHLLDRASPRGPARLGLDALDVLQRHPLHGNVRQLDHVLRAAAALGDGIVSGELLRALLRGDEVGDLVAPLAPSNASTPSVSVPEPTSARPRSRAEHQERERERILMALDESGWNRAQAARSLGIPRRTFYRRLAAHGILES